MHEEMRSAKMIDDALRVFRIEEYSQFRNFDDALDELTRKLYEGDYYITPNSFASISYNLELHRFQTFASSSSSIQDTDARSRTDDGNWKAQYPSIMITIVKIKTNQNEFDDYIGSIINKHTYTLEDLTKDEYRKLIIDHTVYLQMEKIQLNPLQIPANDEIQSKDITRLISKLQYTLLNSDSR
jgi:hypothetical protein